MEDITKQKEEGVDCLFPGVNDCINGYGSGAIYCDLVGIGLH